MNLDMNVITLAVEDVDRAKRFYVEGLGRPVVQDHGGFVRLGLGDGSSGLALYQRDALADDAGVAAEGSGFRAVTFSWIAESADEVDTVIARAVRAGGTVTKPAKRALWGGYDGYVADPDGHLWKITSSNAPPRFRRRSAPVTVDAPSEPHEVIVTLGVADIKQARQFYEAVGFPVDKSYAKFVSFAPEDTAGLGLYTRKGLAADASVAPDGSGFRAFTLSHVAESPDEVDTVIARAVDAGATVTKPAEKAQWGGYSGVVTTPDGVLWKVAST